MKLVLLPGMDGTGQLFERFVRALPPELVPKVISYPSNQALGYDALTAHVRSALPENTPFVLLGESFSGPIVVRLAAEQLSGLVAIVLCCTFVRNPSSLLKLLRPLLSGIPFHWRISHFIGAHLLGISSDVVLRRTVVRAIDEVRPEVLSSRLIEIQRIDVSNELSKISVPAIYFRGTRDSLVPRTCSNEILSLMPSIEVAELNAPHMLLQTIPERAAQELTGFLIRRLGAL